MSARSEYTACPGRLGGALAALGDWLIEPLPESERSLAPSVAAPRPIVAVAGLAPRCGVSLVARALAVGLALADPHGVAALVVPDHAAPVLAPAAPAAARLRTRLRQSGLRASASGRLCLVRAHGPQAGPLARRDVPLVIDTPHGGELRDAAAGADLVVLVAPDHTEPALADLLAASLVERPVLVAANRARDPQRWAGRAAVVLPESRLGARLVAAGRPPGGVFGRAIGELASACGAVACA